MELTINSVELKAGLYLVASPIGNLSDISIRSLEICMSADIIACEDTRVYQLLAKKWHLPIKKVVAYHKHNESASTKGLIKDIQSGKSVVLLSDAGSINISDPGSILVKQALLNQIYITSLPGASALTTAISLSPTHGPFTFHGFVEKNSNKRKKWLLSLCNDISHVCYESPHRIEAHIEDAISSIPNRKLLVCKDLTKPFEKVALFDLQDLRQNLLKSPPKGEYTLIYLPIKDDTPNEEELTKHIKKLLNKNLSNKDILTELRKNFPHVKRKQVYDLIEKLKQVTP